jgi:hypothetical protein
MSKNKLDLETLLTAPRKRNPVLCSLGTLLTNLPAVHSKALNNYLTNPAIGTNTIQTLILKAGLPTCGWTTIKRHRDGLCACAKKGSN